jgi:homoserine acetyltransferase
MFTSTSTIYMAGPERFERPTPSFVAKCSIQLSYGPEIIMESHLDYIGKEFLSAIDANALLTNSFPSLALTAKIFLRSGMRR